MVFFFIYFLVWLFWFFSSFYFLIPYHELINTAIRIFPEKDENSCFSLQSYCSFLLLLVLEEAICFLPDFMISSEMCRWNVF